MKNKIRVFEAFAGYGSQSMALRRLGIDYEVIGISEIDKYAIQAYMAVHGETPNYGDISKIDWKEVPDFDFLTYSFPCTAYQAQDFRKVLKKAAEQGVVCCGNARRLSKRKSRNTFLWKT